MLGQVKFTAESTFFFPWAQVETTSLNKYTNVYDKYVAVIEPF